MDPGRLSSRSQPDDYPLFLAVREQDVDDWEAFFESFDLPTTFERQPRDELDGPLQVVLEPRSSLDIEHIEGYPVIPRAETIEYMRENYTQFQSGLAMLDRMYEDLDLGVAYRETERTWANAQIVRDFIGRQSQDSLD